MPSREVKDILNALRRQIERLERITRQLSHPGPGQLRDSIRHVAIEGVATTHILQNLRGKVEGFDLWWDKWQQHLRDDELARFFYQLRTRILKRGEDNVGIRRLKPTARLEVDDRGFSYSYVDADGKERAELIPRPPGTTAAFMADEAGGAGFIVNGKKQYVSIPPQVTNLSFDFEVAPTSHKGQPLKTRSAAYLCNLYTRFLREIVNDALAVFR